MNRNLNLNTLLPKLATILPLLGIGLNLTLHLICTGSLVSFDWQWSLIGLIAAVYFGIFCKFFHLAKKQSHQFGQIYANIEIN